MPKNHGQLEGSGLRDLLVRNVLESVALNSSAIGLVEAVPMPVGVLLETMVLGALIGVFSAYFPARSAARRNIVDALRMVA
jgi:ABC-type antimicrobial peptide transport system permease subunit